jgi:DNA-binding beta-propeller fold protein YncE
MKLWQYSTRVNPFMGAVCGTTMHRSLWTVLFVLVGGFAVFEPVLAADREAVGVVDAYTTQLPVNQVITPVGKQVPLPGMRPQVLAMSPDGRFLVTSGKTHDLVLVDPDTGRVLGHVPLPSEKLNTPEPEPPSANILQPDTKAQVSYTGLLFSPDGKRLYLSNVNGSVKVFEVAGGGAGFVFDSFAAGERAQAGSGDSCRAGDFAGWQAFVCGVEPVESTGGGGHGKR